jgi:hypothetical protein
MLQVTRLISVTHAVAAAPAAEEMYKRIFDAQVFHRGSVAVTGRKATLALVSTVCFELVTATAQERDLPYIKKYGGLFTAMLLGVKDLQAAGDALQQAGVRIIDRRPHFLAAHPDDMHGTRYEFTDAALPKDPRLIPEWNADRWAKSPMGINGLRSMSVLVEDTRATEPLWKNVFHAEPIGALVNGVHAKLALLYMLGGAQFSVIMPAGPDSTLAKVIHSQGAGIHSVGFSSTDIDVAATHFRSKGVGVMKEQSLNRLTLHPRSLMGARILVMRRPGPGEPDYVWKQNPAKQVRWQ